MKAAGPCRGSLRCGPPCACPSGTARPLRSRRSRRVPGPPLRLTIGARLPALAGLADRAAPGSLASFGALSDCHPPSRTTPALTGAGHRMEFTLNLREGMEQGVSGRR